MQTVRVTGACLSGTGAELVTVEARFERHDRERTEIVITGLPDPVTRESRGRLQSALAANGLHLPQGRLYLNLVPAARRKFGEALDLALAIGAGAAGGHLPGRLVRRTLFFGEVGIDGRLHDVPGGFAAARAAHAGGLTSLVAPPATATEAACLPGARAYGVRDLRGVLAHLFEPTRLAPTPPPADAMDPPGDPSGDPAERSMAADERAAGARAALAAVRGQAVAKRALAAAAAGGHALLLIGPPGAGKSMLAQRLVDLLPPPRLEERLAITEVLSATGRWPGGLAKERPFRAPHHTLSHAALVGGGSPPMPGEITLAHGGVLFLDELAEFRRATLESLRQPLEEGRVLVSRAASKRTWPARFRLVCAMNPCPCGYRGHPRVVCRCPPTAIDRYVRRVSGPLLDRIELRVELMPPTPDELLASATPAAAPRERRGKDGDRRDPDWGARVGLAVARAHARQGASNASLTGDELDRHVPLDARAKELIVRAAAQRQLSARALQALRRTARTLADLDDLDQVGSAQLAEALALRSPLLEP